MAEKRIIATEIEYEPLKDSERFTRDEQIDQCCEPVSVDECADVGKVSPFVSRDQEEWDFDPDEIAAGYAKTYGDKFLGYELHQVGPKGNCGEKHETWQDRLNCCDEVEPLVYDTDNSVSVLSPGTRGVVEFTGGKLPVLVQIMGNGFSLDGYNTREAWAYSRSFYVYAHEFACGTAPITLDDGCSTAQGSVRSTQGQWLGGCYTYTWMDRGYRYGRYYVLVPKKSGCSYYHVNVGYYYEWVAVSGGRDLVITWHWDNDSYYGWEPGARMAGCRRTEYEALKPVFQGMGIPANTDPKTYAPNGPGDFIACSEGCQFVC